MKLRVLSRDDLDRALPMADVVEVVKDAFVQLSSGDALVPVRTQLDVERHGGTTLVMPAYLRRSDELGMKVVSVFPRNRERGLPTIHALVNVVDPETGRPTGVLDGTHLTALRTGAASGAATDVLAREDATTAAVFGAGVQGRTQLRAVAEVRGIERAWIYDPDEGAAREYAEEMGRAGPPVPEDLRVAAGPAEALAEADVVCTATTGSTPVFDDADLRPGTHVNAVGAFTPDTREIPGATVVQARVFVDSREACWEEAGDLIIPRDEGLIDEGHVRAEVGELLASSEPGRRSDEEITLFKSVGVAVQDVSVAARALEEAAAADLGTEVEL